MADELRSEFGTIVKVRNNVEMEKKDGSGTYEVTVIKFKNKFGEKIKQVLTNFLDKNEKLSGQIEDLSPGDFVEFKSTKNGNFLQLKEVLPAKKEQEAAASSVSKNYTQKSGYADNSIGLQVGNALTNAATLLAHGKGLDTLEKTAVMILQLGESLKTRLSAGEFKSGAQEEKSTAKAAKPVTKKVTKPAVKKEDDEDNPAWEDDDSDSADFADD